MDRVAEAYAADSTLVFVHYDTLVNRRIRFQTRHSSLHVNILPRHAPPFVKTGHPCMCTAACQLHSSSQVSINSFETASTACPHTLLCCKVDVPWLGWAGPS